MSPLFIIGLDQDTPQNLGELAREMGYADAQIVAGDIRQAISALDARTAPPEHIVIDIGRRGADVLADLDEMALHCDPSVKVIAIGSVNDIGFYREIRQRGVLEYFTRPVQPDELRAALAQDTLAAQARRKNDTPGCMVIACMSAASGDGASTLAVNLAYCLAEEFKQPTVLVDMDYQFGLVAKSLDRAAPFGTRELFENPDRGLDATLVDKMLVKYGANLNLIASPGELRLMPTIRPETLRDLLGILRAKFTFVIIDMPHTWTDWTMAALHHSDHVMMVGQLWLRSLTHATRLLLAWQEAGISRSRVSLVINRSGAKFKEAVTAQDFETICRQKVEAHMNNDIKTVVSAEHHGRTIFEAGQDTLLAQQVRQIAQGLVLRCQGTSQPEPAPAIRKTLRSLLTKKTG